MWDLAYAAQAFTLGDITREPDEAARDPTAFIEGYGADRMLRAALPVEMCRRAEAMYDLLESSHATGREPWASMYSAGHGDHWRTATAYARRRLARRSDALASSGG